MLQKKEKLGISRESYFDCPRDQTSLEKILRMSSYVRSSNFKGLQTHALICFHVTLCFFFRHIEEKNIDTVNAGIDCFPFQDDISVNLNSRCFSLHEE